MSGPQSENPAVVTRIALRIQERDGLHRPAVDIATGLPLPRGLLRDARALALEDADGNTMPHQFRVLARWPDGSVKWVLMDAVVQADAHGARTLFVTARAGERPATHPRVLEQRPDHVQVNTDRRRFEFARDGGALFKVFRTDAAAREDVVSLLLADRAGTPYVTCIDSVHVEHRGVLTTTLVLDGGFERDATRAAIEFRARVTIHSLLDHVRLDVQLRNPRAAQHLGGLWDLGDPSSFRFGDCSVRVRTAGGSSVLTWKAVPSTPLQECAGDWSLYQDSSGGEQWNSVNHVDAAGRLTVVFRGYAVSGAERTVGRAQPMACIRDAQGSVAVAVPKFWQQFPKALRRRGGELEIGLFPRECQPGFELQAGERKRHSIVIAFGPADADCALDDVHLPLLVTIDPQWVESTGAVPYFVPRTPQSPDGYQRYVESIIEGRHSFFEKRERIDEYGWRHFGDLYGDHEAVKHTGAQPFISHYNNQYDFIHGAAIHFLRSGDARWCELMADAARHTLDIDIYHTQEDKPAFNGGLFWHTDHYVPAATSTHRTYSAANAADGAYGGGPSNEHNYTSGLLYYHYLSGDPEAKDAVLELADWVIGMDDGSGTLLGFATLSATGLASKTVDMSFHKAGRGAGNSINALLDAHAVSGRRHYLLKAEELIQRCIHPQDDIAALQLGEPEHRWSYLAFLQVLGKFLALKTELGERDYGYHYARESLLAYAEWMLANEVPYRDVLHKVLIPTETWPAQDIRKAHVLYLAAKYCRPEARDAFRARAAFFFERCLSDLLSFETAYLTRPQVLLCVYGYVHEYFQKAAADPDDAPAVHGHDFGQPQTFRTQRHLLGQALRAKRGLLAREVQRMAREGVYRLRRKLGMTARGGK